MRSLGDLHFCKALLPSTRKLTFMMKKERIDVVLRKCDSFSLVLE